MSPLDMEIVKCLKHQCGLVDAREMRGCWRGGVPQQKSGLAFSCSEAAVSESKRSRHLAATGLKRMCMSVHLGNSWGVSPCHL